MKTRLDAELVRRGLARSREIATELIEEKLVLVSGIPATKAATQVDAETSITLRAQGDKYVSRGGFKLNGALDFFTAIDVKDKFVYNRSGATKYHVYLETCYLSWVSGMYRKSIHEKFGFYDEEFRASGDTEFKNRVLKNINVEFIDETLGVFMDYPEIRATGSPIAEVEDSRAWYLFRTSGGIEYLFENEKLDTCISVFKLAICYRKSYKTELSSDLIFALNLSKFIVSRFQNSPIPTKIINSLQTLVDSIIDLQSCDKNFTMDRYYRLLNYYFCKSKFKYSLKSYDEKLQTLDYLTVDNMFEQHSWIW